jgi:hypothetical protein
MFTKRVLLDSPVKHTLKKLIKITSSCILLIIQSTRRTIILFKIKIKNRMMSVSNGP